MGSIMTTEAEKQKKIGNIHIDFDSDNILPELNREDLEKIGAESKPVLLKKSIIEKNKKHHPDVSQEEYEKIIGTALYNPEKVLRANIEKPYYNFIIRVREDKSSIVLLDMSDKNNNFEIINCHYIKERQLRQKENTAQRTDKNKKD